MMHCGVMGSRFRVQCIVALASSSQLPWLLQVSSTTKSIHGNFAHVALCYVVAFAKASSAQHTTIEWNSTGPVFLEDPRDDVRNKSGVSARISRRCYEETAVVEFKLYIELCMSSLC